MVDYANTEIAFKMRSNGELRRAEWLFELLGHPGLVKVGSRTALWALRQGLPIQGLVRQTVFRQFCGGETMDECAPVIQRMKGFGVHSILDYSVEGKERESDFVRTAQVTIDALRFSAQHPGVPLGVFKPTGLGRIALWEKVSAQRGLNIEEQSEWERVRHRVQNVCLAARNARVPLMFDAEESWMQDAADDLCLEMMRLHNRERVWVYNTVQMYRHDRLAYVQSCIEMSEKEGFKVGFKVVRGAYMEKERERAESLGYPSPIQPDKTATDQDYDRAIELLLEHLDRTALVAGTHNEESCRKLVALMGSRKIPASDARVWFSQLYGMSDNLSFNLAAEGYNVVKYLPFGPVADVMPYLIRRAEENTSIGGQTGRELRLIRQELKRRKR
ncbi:proline dehydrogenase [bacterium]|nr:proline dehydrogenase [bacterium]